jgi:hypothetical protein
MSRERVQLPSGGYIIWGYDAPFGSYYAQLYHDQRSENDAPDAVIGYHPAEVEITKLGKPDCLIGPYPVASQEELLRLMNRDWNIDLMEHLPYDI